MNWRKSWETRRSRRISSRLCNPDLTKNTLTENVSLLKKRGELYLYAGHSVLWETIDGLEFGEEVWC